MKYQANICSNKITVREALKTLDQQPIKTLFVQDESKSIIGSLTDGDIRRGLEYKGNTIFDQTADCLMSPEPKWVTADTLVISALELMEKHSITSLFVFSNTKLKKPDGVVHIHDILKTGIQ